MIVVVMVLSVTKVRRNSDENGRRSTPVDVGLVVDALAELKGLEPGEVSAVTARNTEKLFGI